MYPLQTNLDHIHSEEEFQSVIKEHENVMICCGRMGPMCLPVYDVMENIRDDYEHVAFYDLPFDAPYSHVIRNLPETRGFMGLPYTVYFRNGEVVKATTSIQTKKHITGILDDVFDTVKAETE